MIFYKGSKSNKKIFLAGVGVAGEGGVASVSVLF